MASIFERIRQGFKNMTASTVAASEKGDEPKTAAGRVGKNILTDLSISLGNTEGLSDEALADYERRTEQSKQAMADLQAQNKKNSGSSPPQASTRPAISVRSTAAAPPQMNMDGDAPGSAEEDVEATLRKKGRRSTIQTTSQGLLTSAPTRRRRSLMGGGLIS